MSHYQRFRAQFAEAMDPRLYSIEYLDRLVANMQAQCWFSDNACIVTQVKTYPTGTQVIHGLVAAVDPGSEPGAGLNEIVETLIPRAETWGKLAGCSLASIESKAGWGRVLKQSGYQPFQQILMKELP